MILNMTEAWQQYETIQLLGKGAFGEVYMVKHKTEDKHYAMKTFLRRGELSIPEINEIDVLCRFKHPYLLHAVDCFYNPTTNQVCLILPLSNKDLWTIIHEVGMFNTYQAKSLVYHLCNAVLFLHTNNMFHCDIKPPNILLIDNSRFVLADFGLSYPFATDQPDSTVCGTIGFASPQTVSLTQLPDKYHLPESQQKPNFIQSDLFAVGMTLFFVLTYEFVKNYDNLADFMTTRLAERRQTIPAEDLTDFDELVSICMQMTKVSQTERTVSVQQILGSPLYKSYPPEAGSIVQVTVTSIPNKILTTSFNEVIRKLFNQLIEIQFRAECSHPMHVMCLAIELFTRSCNLIEDSKQLQVYGVACFIMADWLLNSKKMTNPMNFVSLYKNTFTPKNIETAIGKIIGYCQGRLRSQTLLSSVNDAYVVLYYIHQLVYGNATTMLTYQPNMIKEEYMLSDQAQDKQIDVQDVLTFYMRQNIATMKLKNGHNIMMNFD